MKKTLAALTLAVLLMMGCTAPKGIMKDKDKSIAMLRHFLSNNSIVIIATPVKFFKQELYESEYEKHISHWTANDFRKLGYVDLQYFDGGCVYLLSSGKISIRGFGNSLIHKCKRIVKAFLSECR